MNKYWLKDPKPHDFPAAIDYLELLFSIGETKAFVNNLQIAITIKKRAKDILRASNLPSKKGGTNYIFQFDVQK